MHIVHKAVACVVRTRPGGVELLVFRHPIAGVQIPKGSLEPGEEAEAAALRELEEESGISVARILRELGQHELEVGAGSAETGQPERHIWHTFLLTADDEARDTWRHSVSGSGVEVGMLFEYFWLPLAEARRRSAARFHPSIDLITAALPTVTIAAQQKRASDGGLRIPAALAALAELDLLFRGHDVDYWVFGGWAVDFHVGRLTRDHSDIDIAIWFDERTQFDTLLRDHAWTHRPDVGEDGYTCYERNDIRLEVAFLARDERGQVYTPVSDGRGEWPDHSFGEDVAELLGVRARVVSRASLIADKSIARSDASTAEKDRLDVAALLDSAHHSQ